MNDGALLLDGLKTQDVEWLFQTAKEQEVSAGASVIREGENVTALYIVLQGYLGVFLESVTDGQIAALGQGEIAGEMSFIESLPAVATVKAVEPSTVLALSFSDLHLRIKRDPSFGSRFFHSLARLISRRLRAKSGGTANPVTPDAVAADGAAADIGARNRTWRRAEEVVGKLVSLLEKTSPATPGTSTPQAVSPRDATAIAQAVGKFARELEEILGADSLEGPLVREEIGHHLQTLLMPWMQQSSLIKRLVTKPRGYAGDYISMVDIHSQIPGGAGVGPALDKGFLSEPFCQAVRARRNFIANEIRGLVRAGSGAGKTVRVTSLASGPADELFDSYEELNTPELLQTTLINIDSQARMFLEAHRERRFLEPYMKILSENVLYLTNGKSSITLPPQDFVYTVGLIDYFDDNTAVAIINFLHGITKPNGTLSIGGFAPSNPSRAFMDHILEWRLVHRTPEDLSRLFSLSNFKRPTHKLKQDDTKVSFCAECERG